MRQGDNHGAEIESHDTEKKETNLKEALDSLDDNHGVEKDLEDKLQEVESVCNPIIGQVYEKSERKYLPKASIQQYM
uniref:Uncharacterized protein n=1 Tax=Nymphaea colorata TaxID=210225 RepID=A0A5K1GBA4_9MAGN